MRLLLWCLVSLGLLAATHASAEVLIRFDDEWLTVSEDFSQADQDAIIKLNTLKGLDPLLIKMGLIGEIKPVHVTAFNNLIKFARRYKKRAWELRINSPGGDVQTAMTLGRLVFSNRMNVKVEAGHECLSACVLVLAGGDLRIVYGTVGIHRPFETTVRQLSKSGSELADKYEKVEVEMANFFREMAVSPQLLDLMMATPSTKMRILTGQELEDFGLGEQNVANIELERERLVRECGAEYTKRTYQARAKTSKVCSNAETFMACSLRISREYGVKIGGCNARW
jgi:ATP-dependent protease ClpP protease subunit